MSTEGDQRTPSAAGLAKFLAGANPLGERIPLRVAAAALRLSEATISRYADGLTIPNWPDRWVIETWTNGKVKARGWCTRMEQERINFAHEIKPLRSARSRTKRTKETT